MGQAPIARKAAPKPKPDQPGDRHQQGEAPGAQAAMRGEQGVEQHRLCGGIAHGWNISPRRRRAKLGGVVGRGRQSMAKKVRKSGGRLKPAEIAEVFDRFAAANPDPRGELEYANPYTLLVAVVLSAQATEPRSTRRPSPCSSWSIAGEDAEARRGKLKGFIKTIGLFNTKAKNIIRLAQILIEQHGGTVPVDREILQTLPGVGRKTANVVLNIAFGHPTMAVDTHIFRSATAPACPGKDAAGGRAQAGEARAVKTGAPRPSLADPARPLRLQGPQARLPRLPRQRHLPLQGERRSISRLRQIDGLCRVTDLLATYMLPYDL